MEIRPHEEWEQFYVMAKEGINLSSAKPVNTPFPDSESPHS